MGLDRDRGCRRDRRRPRRCGSRANATDEDVARRLWTRVDRTVEHEGDRRAGERELRGRQKRHDALDIRPLSAGARERYVQRWQATQVRFVDDPSGVVIEADALVQQVMKERGYPTDDFEQRAADISVEHPELVERYRTAHGIAESNERGRASTEDLRQSVRHYRALFEELLGGSAADAPISRDAAREEDAVAEREESGTRTRTS